MFVGFMSSKSNIPKEYELMKNTSVINYSFDYSAMRVKKVNIKSYVEMKLNMPYENFTKSLENVLLESANEVLSTQGMKLVGNNESSDIEMRAMFLNTDPDGEHSIMVKIVHKPSDTLISSFDINSNGGSGDSFAEMFLNGLQKTGEKVGKKINKI